MTALWFGYDSLPDVFISPRVKGCAHRAMILRDGAVDTHQTE